MLYPTRTSCIHAVSLLCTCCSNARRHSRHTMLYPCIVHAHHAVSLYRACTPCCILVYSTADTPCCILVSCARCQDTHDTPCCAQYTLLLPNNKKTLASTAAGHTHTHTHAHTHARTHTHTSRAHTRVYRTETCRGCALPPSLPPLPFVSPPLCLTG